MTVWQRSVLVLALEFELMELSELVLHPDVLIRTGMRISSCSDCSRFEEVIAPVALV